MMDHCGFPKKCLGERGGWEGIEGVIRGLDAVIDMSEQELSLCTLYFFLSLPFFCTDHISSSFSSNVSKVTSLCSCLKTLIVSGNGQRDRPRDKVTYLAVVDS